MPIPRRRLVKALGITGTVLSSAGCFALDETSSHETTDSTDTRTETPTTTAGWATEIPETPPSVSCKAVSRPMAEPVDREGALAPRDYPGRPPSEAAGKAAVEYVTRFELAYRHNDEMISNTDVATGDERDKYLTRFDISVQNSWVAAGPADSSVVRLQYVGSGTIHPGIEFDYITQYVTYYIDSTRVVRARTTQNDFVGTDALDPDPWVDGDPVACFEK
ncbi:hypothetical protein SAMN05216388_1003328 [Halorientalis persicus]|uniref:Uncharacterized protein n=2 Tax=Halorientalis persicus TaxID=1367881 RepID=A0A1H8HAZ5_9EURY|nr:hypothetical protein SAMN05216388_1003328 [Halorientalis persicus]